MAEPEPHQGEQLAGDSWAMVEAFELARSCDYATNPHPMVGAVVVCEGRVVGRGRTAPPGGPHAEVSAPAAAGEAAREPRWWSPSSPAATWAADPSLHPI
jgi:diaminohydroxyphosphoribosylaminopyrimidine deaminase/5-amino-6-(5-phosphoribosylamino)uracil reductase